MISLGRLLGQLIYFCSLFRSRLTRYGSWNRLSNWSWDHQTDPATKLVRYRCCLPIPLTLVCGGSPIIPLLVHQPAYLASSSITPAGSVHESRGDSVVRMCVQLKRWCVSCVCCRWDIVVMDVIWRRLCVSMIWGREICLFWVGKGCISSALLLCGGGVRSFC